MRPTPLMLTLAGILMFSAYSFAQADSAFLNTGNAMLSKDFTQHITIKSEDLERFPFSSLDEAINVYFYGAYTNAGSTTYLIDGNLFNDVNAYSIHDIESITLVQNAQALLNGADNPKQLILIKTRASNTRPSGNILAADIYPGRYQQLYLSKANSGKHMQVGASLNFMRETGPNQKADTIVSYLSPRISQFRGNAWMNTEIGSHSTLTLRVNAATGANRFEQERIPNSYTTEDSAYKYTNLLIIPSLRLSTTINKSWSNEFNASYTYGKQHTVDQKEAGFPDYKSLKTADDKRSSQTIILREQLQYHKNINGWDLRPTASISFIYRKERWEAYETIIYDNGFQSQGRSKSSPTQQSLFVSPAMHIGYKDWFAMQGGIQAATSKRTSMPSIKADNISPFASASVNITRIINPQSLSILKAFGSYAKTTIRSHDIVFGVPGLGGTIDSNGFYIVNPIIKPYPESLSNNFSAGSTLQTLNNSLLVSYTYEKRKYDIPTQRQLIINTGFPGAIIYADATINLSMHRFALQYAFKNAVSAEWRSGINIANVKPTIVYYGGYTPQVGTHQDLYPQQGWSGGWTNHFRFNKITAGLNALYFFNEQRFFRPSRNAPLQSMKANSFLLQHVYLGMKLEKKNLRSEIFASARNLFQNKKSTLTNGDIRYIGLGVKADL